MDVIADRALECADVKARGAGGDPCQHRCCFALRTWWSVKRAHDAVPLHQAGAQHSQSPIGADKGGDATSMFSRVSKLLVNTAHFINNSQKICELGEIVKPARGIARAIAMVEGIVVAGGSSALSGPAMSSHLALAVVALVDVRLAARCGLYRLNPSATGGGWRSSGARPLGRRSVVRAGQQLHRDFGRASYALRDVGQGGR